MTGALYMTVGHHMCHSNDSYIDYLWMSCFKHIPYFQKRSPHVTFFANEKLFQTEMVIISNTLIFLTRVHAMRS
jgi:hypothetical protein